MDSSELAEDGFELWVVCSLWILERRRASSAQRAAPLSRCRKVFIAVQ